MANGYIIYIEVRNGWLIDLLASAKSSLKHILRLSCGKLTCYDKNLIFNLGTRVALKSTQLSDYSHSPAHRLIKEYVV